MRYTIHWLPVRRPRLRSLHASEERWFIARAGVWIPRSRFARVRFICNVNKGGTIDLEHVWTLNSAPSLLDRFTGSCYRPGRDGTQPTLWNRGSTTLLYSTSARWRWRNFRLRPTTFGMQQRNTVLPQSNRKMFWMRTVFFIICETLRMSNIHDVYPHKHGIHPRLRSFVRSVASPEKHDFERIAHVALPDDESGVPPDPGSTPGPRLVLDLCHHSLQLRIEDERETICHPDEQQRGRNPIWEASRGPHKRAHPEPTPGRSLLRTPVRIGTQRWPTLHASYQFAGKVGRGPGGTQAQAGMPPTTSGRGGAGENDAACPSGTLQALDSFPGKTAGGMSEP